MDLQKDIKKLVTYGLDKKLIMPEDEIYTINQYLEVFRLDEYEDPDIEGEEIILPEILDRLTDTAYDRYIIKSDDIVTRDLFDTKTKPGHQRIPYLLRRESKESNRVFL